MRASFNGDAFEVECMDCQCAYSSRHLRVRHHQGLQGMRSIRNIPNWKKKRFCGCSTMPFLEGRPACMDTYCWMAASNLELKPYGHKYKSDSVWTGSVHINPINYNRMASASLHSNLELRAFR
eukprot:1800470-Amphidinium_carterae.1